MKTMKTEGLWSSGWYGAEDFCACRKTEELPQLVLHGTVCGPFGICTRNLDQL